MKKWKRRGILLLCLLLVTILPLAGCKNGGVEAAGGDLMAGFTGKKLEKVDVNGSGVQEVTDFSVELMKQALKGDPGKNVLLSPLSVLNALAMTAHGADGETLRQLESVFGLPVEELSKYLAAYLATMPSGEKYRFHTANSLWLREGIKVNRDFLQKNADYFGADIFQKSFDKSTLEEINQWVNDNTQGMIPSILNEIRAEDILFLINALSFEAEWAKPYDEYNVFKQVFTHEDGTDETVDMMCSSETYYLKDENGVGFLKDYADNAYAFAALLPNGGLRLEDYLAGLNGKALREILTSVEEKEVLAELPKFEMKYSAELSEILQAMGVQNGFDPAKADFSSMAETELSLYIGSVMHKTYISVFEQGTRAAAVTEVVEAGGCAEEEPERIRLDRPFLYMIVDKEAMLPIFIGAVYSVGE